MRQNLHARVQFYDGMGRQIQTKNESGANATDNEAGNIVVDKVYDGMGNVIASNVGISEVLPSR